MDCQLRPEKLAEELTFLGLEVDGIEERGTGLDQIIVGEVLSTKPHPEAGELLVCQVDVDQEVLQTISGASNLREGDLVPVAPPGSRLPGGKEIEELEFKGVTSRGMLCSTDELGLTEERAEGIMILPAELEPGQRLLEAMELQEWVLRLDLTPNYGHCLSLLGVAREVAALLGSEVTLPEMELKESGPPAGEKAGVEIKDADGCPRYSARIITGIEVGPSPFWLQQRLLAAGIRPINNVVDITNYVMLELGQPLHAFDYDLIRGKEIIVRRARRGEQLVTLDDQTRELLPSDLVICDQEGPIALAGVMGGASTEVSGETKSLLLESANFHPVSVRKTAKRLSLPSEASHRFERGVDINGTCRALDRAAGLLARMAGGQVLPGTIDSYPDPGEERVIRLRSSGVKDLLGIELEKNEVASLLEALQLGVKKEEDGELRVSIPSFRPDLEGEADLIEEVARHHGYNNIPLTLPQGMGQGRLTTGQRVERRARRLLQAMGLSEVINYSFIAPEPNQSFSAEIMARGDSLKLNNPLSEEMSVMRRSLIPGLLETVRRNINRSQEKVAVFELGALFCWQEGRVLEEEALAAVHHGEADDPWDLEAGGFYYLKGVMERLLARLGIKSLSLRESSFDFLHPGRQAYLELEGKVFGLLGELLPSLQQEYELRERLAVFEVDFSYLQERASFETDYQSLPRYPGTSRDLALILDQKVHAHQVEEIISKMGKPLLQNVQLFDLYRGPQLPADKKSLAYNLHFQSPERTLTDEEVDLVVEKIIAALKERTDAEIRQ